MNQHRTATIKVGLLTTISLIVLITTVIWLRGRTLGGGQNYDVLYRDVDGLRDGAPVQFMGIRVGFVDLVEPIHVKGKDYRVRVRFTITQPDVKIPMGSLVSLEQTGIIGEKYLEITPPRSRTYTLASDQPEPRMFRKLPILVAFSDDIVKVGQVSGVEETEVPKVFRKKPSYEYEFQYTLNLPGYLPPSDPEFKLVQETPDKAFLLLEDHNARWQQSPSKTAYFTLEEPLRLKDFLEEQLASAQALKMTNQKINQLLSDETITTIQGTLKNSEKLTAQAASTLSEANNLFASTSKDLRILVASTQDLTNSVVSVSNNINAIAGDPQLKANIQKTVSSVEQSTASLNQLLNDPNLKLMLSDARVTSQNAAELMTYLKHSAVDNNLQGRINESLTLLNSSLTRLSNIMGSVETATGDKETIQGILQDTKETTDNLNRFSERLNKRFLLFRLLF